MFAGRAAYTHRTRLMMILFFHCKVSDPVHTRPCFLCHLWLWWWSKDLTPRRTLLFLSFVVKRLCWVWCLSTGRSLPSFVVWPRPDCSLTSLGLFFFFFSSLFFSSFVFGVFFLAVCIVLNYLLLFLHRLCNGGVKCMHVRSEPETVKFSKGYS